MSFQTSDFGKSNDGSPVSLYTLTNQHGFVVKLTDFGAIVVSVEVPDRNGKIDNINVGFNSLEGYLQDHPFFGATVGRYCNRIANGKFTLDGETYSLATNNGPHHLHGGDIGFDKYIWDVERIENSDGVGIRFSRTSLDGEEGYPGTLQVTAFYFLSNNNELKVEFTAETDKATPLNLTNHCYWNLDGVQAGSIRNHELLIEADEYLEVDSGAIPQRIAKVEGTPFDFRDKKSIGQDIAHTPGGENYGYDHCYVLRSKNDQPTLAARVSSPESGRVMEIHTTQPGIQLYTGNFLDGSLGCSQHGAFCLETQHFPDSPNQPNFPSTILRPGETFRETTIHRFLLDS